MKRSPVLATLLLPALGGEASQAAPVWAICMIGNLVAVRRSQV